MGNSFACACFFFQIPREMDHAGKVKLISTVLKEIVIN